ncbi:MAG: F0F1 ATP synthase subunit A [Lachnospiraceae bacterium]|nr:F0F1 ATP synthase subunit A [Lachnospiraceae bacterium]
MGTYMLAATDVDFMVHGLFQYEIFGQKLWITTTHVCTLIVMLILIIFALVVNIKIRKVRPEDEPKGLINACEIIVEKLDGMVINSMGEKHYRGFVNYIGTIFGFILLSNISGLLGLRPPTADYGVTFPLAVITFCLIHYNQFKYQKVKGVIAGLCDPWPIWAPINIVSDFAVPISLSLRLFANVLSGTAIMALIYALLSKFAVIWPAALHFYFDLFSGAIQTYVFSMLTMTYITNAFGEEN